jgi:hypothetical protein
MPKKQRRPQPGNREHGETIRQLEQLIEQGSQRIYQAAINGDALTLEINTRAWTQAQGLWLQTVQGLSVEQARDVIVEFATRGAFSAWADGLKSGPPPTVLSLYKQDGKNEDGK